MNPGTDAKELPFGERHLPAFPDWRELIQWIRLKIMQTLAETPEYIRRVEKLLTDDERRDILNYLAAHPKAGDLIEGTESQQGREKHDGCAGRPAGVGLAKGVKP